MNSLWLLGPFVVKFSFVEDKRIYFTQRITRNLQSLMNNNFLVSLCLGGKNFLLNLHSQTQ